MHPISYSLRPMALLAIFALLPCLTSSLPSATAEESANAAQAAEPATAEAYDVRGIKALDKGAYDPAIADFTAAIGLKPEDALAYTKRAWAHDRKGENDLAVADFGKAIEIDPAAGDAYYGRGRAFFGKHDYKRAIEDCTKAIKQKKPSPMAYVIRSYAYATTGETKKAVDDAKKASKLSPPLAARVWRDLGRIRYNAADFKTAAKCFAASLGAAGEDTATQFDLGLSLAATNNWYAAEPEYVAAIAVATHSEIEAALARAEEAARQHPEIATLNQAIWFLKSSPRR